MQKEILAKVEAEKMEEKALNHPAMMHERLSLKERVRMSSVPPRKTQSMKNNRFSNER